MRRFLNSAGCNSLRNQVDILLLVVAGKILPITCKYKISEHLHLKNLLSPMKNRQSLNKKQLLWPLLTFLFPESSSESSSDFYLIITVQFRSYQQFLKYLRVIFDQLHKYFHTRELYYSSQYGFREKHSTELATLEIIDRIIQEMDKSLTPIYIY